MTSKVFSWRCTHTIFPNLFCHKNGRDWSSSWPQNSLCRPFLFLPPLSLFSSLASSVKKAWGQGIIAPLFMSLKRPFSEALFYNHNLFMMRARGRRESFFLFGACNFSPALFRGLQKKKMVFTKSTSPQGISNQKKILFRQLMRYRIAIKSMALMAQKSVCFFLSTYKNFQIFFYGEMTHFWLSIFSLLPQWQQLSSKKNFSNLSKYL